MMNHILPFCPFIANLVVPDYVTEKVQVLYKVMNSTYVPLSQLVNTVKMVVKLRGQFNTYDFINYNNKPHIMTTQKMYLD